MIRKVKSSPKMFISDKKKLEKIVVDTMNKISHVVGSTLGPGGCNCLIESDYPGLPNKNTKDGVTVFQSLGASNSYEHLIIEQARDGAQRTATEAGDGTTTCTILSGALVSCLYDFCKSNPKYSPQKASREMSKMVREVLTKKIRDRSIKIDENNLDLLRMVAKVSANGDDDMADAVIKAFELLGFGESSHVTIRETSGPYGYEVGLIEGFPIPIGYEESMGKFHSAFINDQSNQRCYLEKPLFILFDGHVNDLVSFNDIFNLLGSEYANGKTEYKNVVIFAYGYSDQVLTQLSFNFGNPNTMNVVPMVVPMQQFMNSQLQSLMDISAFTGAKIFGMNERIATANPQDLGGTMDYFEAYRFRSTIVGDPDELNVGVRAEDLKKQKETAESEAEKRWLEERLGKITNGIAKLTIVGGSSGELKEAHDRCEDAVCAVRSAIRHGVLPGGCRVLLDLSVDIGNDPDSSEVAKTIVAPALMAPLLRLLDNSGYNEEEVDEIIDTLVENPDLVYDVSNQQFGKAEDLGIFDAAPAVEQALSNATSIATVMGTLSGIIAYPRDNQVEMEEARADREFNRAVENPTGYVNEANLRP